MRVRSEPAGEAYFSMSIEPLRDAGTKIGTERASAFGTDGRKSAFFNILLGDVEPDVVLILVGLRSR